MKSISMIAEVKDGTSLSGVSATIFYVSDFAGLEALLEAIPLQEYVAWLDLEVTPLVGEKRVSHRAYLCEASPRGLEWFSALAFEFRLGPNTDLKLQSTIVHMAEVLSIYVAGKRAGCQIQARVFAERLKPAVQATNDAVARQANAQVGGNG